nr:LuxR C-terminal-related transcriptional regulator [Streptomyces sp. SID13726]
MSGLPAAFTSFVGRQRELAEVRRLLGSARLVTLTGAGGVGKTRLALETAAASARSFPGGVWLVDLAPVRDPALVVEAAAVTLGVVDQGTRPVLELLAAQVSGRRLLMVLDNCEHLVEACAELAQGLLSAAPEVRILATSRETLRLTGEHVIAVAPLAPQDAAELLVQRAAAVRPGFRLTETNRAAIDRLCAGLDGLPLAIELAASRLRTLSVEPVVERLEDRFALLTAGSRTAQPHQRTLRAAIDWSWELCGPAERLLWSRLSVFAGSFTLEAAEEVCAGEVCAEEGVGPVGLGGGRGASGVGLAGLGDGPGVPGVRPAGSGDGPGARGERPVVPGEGQGALGVGSTVPGDGVGARGVRLEGSGGGQGAPVAGSGGSGEGSGVSSERSAGLGEGQDASGVELAGSGDGPGDPGERPVVPGEGQGAPVVGSAGSGEGSGVPGERPVVPGEGQGAPVVGSAGSGEGSGVPGGRPAVPAEGQGAPVARSTAPGDGTAAPGASPATSQQDLANLQDGSAPRQEGLAIPQDGSASQQDGSASQQGSLAAPQDGPASPQDGLANPQDRSASPQDAPSPRQHGPATPQDHSAPSQHDPTTPQDHPAPRQDTPPPPPPPPTHLATEEVLDVLDRLVAQSLVELAGTDELPRYRLLETIRQYGAEHLAEGEEWRLRRRHRAFFLTLAERCRQDWFGDCQAESLARLHADHSNLMAALEYQQDTEANTAPDDGTGPGHDLRADRQTALALPAALVFHWIAGGCLSEGRRYLERALTVAPEPTATRLRALLVATHVACIQPDLAAAHRYLDEAAELAVRLGDATAAADVLGHRGVLALHEGRAEEAVDLVGQALAAHTALGDRYGEVRWRCQLGIAQTLGGDPRAPETSARALAAAEEHGERWSRARLLMVLGRRAWEQGEQAEARDQTLSALETLRGFRDALGVADMVEQLAWITASAGDHRRAGRLLGTARSLRGNVGITHVTDDRHREYHDRCTDLVRKALGPDAYDQALEAGAAVNGVAQAIDYALGNRSDGNPSRTGTAAVPPAPASGLTRREEQVVALVARGMTNRRIAAELVLSPRTVDNHVNRILTKLGFSSRAQIAAWWAAK